MNELFDDQDKLAEKDARIAMLERKVQVLEQQLNKLPDAKPISYYNQLKKDDPIRYQSKAIQIQIDRDSQILGMDFFDDADTNPMPRTVGYDRYTGQNAMILDEHKKVR